MFDKALDDYSQALKFVTECFKTQKMCVKPVTDYTTEMHFFPDWFTI